MWVGLWVNPPDCHPREGGDPSLTFNGCSGEKWVPAFAGMTDFIAGMTDFIAGMTAFGILHAGKTMASPGNKPGPGDG